MSQIFTALLTRALQGRDPEIDTKSPEELLAEFDDGVDVVTQGQVKLKVVKDEQHEQYHLYLVHKDHPDSLKAANKIAQYKCRGREGFVVRGGDDWQEDRYFEDIHGFEYWLRKLAQSCEVEWTLQELLGHTGKV
jgi:hypothetical protein